VQDEVLMLLRQLRDGVGGVANPILPLKLCDDGLGWYDDVLLQPERGEPLVDGGEIL
jgi:hypothetical protein